jgi:peptide/nickel transport system substrate-binding protein
MSRGENRVRELVDDYVDRRVSRREFFQRAAAIGLSLPAAGALLAACGGGGGSETAASTTAAASGAGTTEAATSTAPAQAAGGTLKIRLLNDIINVDPPFIPAAADFGASQGVYEGLVTYAPGGWDVVNVLAETFEPSPDNLEYKFTLKKGIQFHGGYGELTADDVKFSYERTAGLTEPKLDSPYKGDWAALKEVKVTGPYEGTIILKDTFAPLMRSTLPIFSGWVVSKKAVEELGKKYPTNPIGTGPYEWVEWKPKQHVRLKKFAQYGGAGKDLLGTAWDEILFTPIEDDQAAGIALETGDVDFGELPLTSIDRFEGDSNFTVEKHTTLDFNWIGMNIRSPKLEDINVRQAIRYVIDVPSILEAAFEGRYTRANAIIAPEMPIGYWKDAPQYDRDVDKAKSFLAKAASAPSELELKFTEEPGSRNISEIVQSNLGDIGIKVNLKQLDSSAYYALDKAELRSRELFYVGYISNPDPYWSTEWFTCDQIDIWNWMYWCDKPFDDLHYGAIKETDSTKRNDMYLQMQQLWDQAVHTVWLAYPTRYFGARKGIQPALRPDGWLLPSAFKAV